MIFAIETAKAKNGIKFKVAGVWWRYCYKTGNLTIKGKQVAQACCFRSAFKHAVLLVN